MKETNNYRSLFVSNEVKTWFKLGKEYDSMTVGLKKSLPAKVIFDATLAEKKMRFLKKQKDSVKTQDAQNEVMKQLYEMARTYLENLLDVDNIRVLPDDLLDELGLEETITHFNNIRKSQSEHMEKQIKK